MDDTPLRVVVVEDEPLARRSLIGALQAIPWIEIVGEGADGAAAVEVIDAARPDLAVMDIVLPGFGALDVLDRVRHPPRVVFITAHDRFAAAAFDLAAIDYVLKPWEPERLRLALERARAAIRLPAHGTERVPTDGARARRALARDERLDTLFVRDRNTIAAIPVAEVVRFESVDAYVAIVARGRRFLVQMALSDVASRLPDRFLRIHRCHVVNLGFVTRFTRHDGGRFIAEMADGSRVIVSRRHARTVRQLALSGRE